MRKHLTQNRVTGCLSDGNMMGLNWNLKGSMKNSSMNNSCEKKRFPHMKGLCPSIQGVNQRFGQRESETAGT